MKIAIITSLCGNIDKLHTPLHFWDYDHYAFVDRVWNTNIWKQKPILEFSQDDKYSKRRNAKLFKILPELFLPNYDYYIHHDSSHDLKMNPEKIIIEYMQDREIAVFKHNQRDCIYQEADKLIEWQYDKPELIKEWCIYLNNIGYPVSNGLYELPAFIKKNTKRMTEMSLMWWEIICKYSSRDQLSLPYCLWKMGIEPAILSGWANGRNPDGSIGCNEIIPQVYEKVR